MMPRFTIVHATNRPYGWQAAYAQYLRRADDKNCFDYVLVIDGDMSAEMDSVSKGFVGSQRSVIINDQGKSYVAAANEGVRVCDKAPIVLMATDDMFPPERWDTLLWELFTSESNKHVAWVNDGVFPHIMTMQIFTRSWYERYGYVFKPEYGSMCGDNDFTQRALRDDVVMDVRERKELHWTHYHHRAGTRPLDSSDEVNQSAERYAQGYGQLRKDWPELVTEELCDELYKQACATTSDINEHLPVLKELVAGKTVLELGTRTGNSSIAFIAGRPKELVSVDLDFSRLDPQIPAGAILAGVPWTRLEQDSRRPLSRKFDVVFFDTLHTEAQLAAEIEAHGDADILIFHDTTTNWTEGESGEPGLRRAIEPLIGKYECKEYTRNNGLMVLTRVKVANEIQQPELVGVA